MYGKGRYSNIQVIEVTDVHPFWVVTDDPDLERAARDFAGGMYHQNIEPTENGFWVEAKDVREGDVFLGANGELSTLIDVERVELEEPITVYNFTVEGNHNYFVIAVTDENGQTSVLVHNAEWDPLKKFKEHPNNAIPGALKIFRVKPTHVPPTSGQQGGYIPTWGMPKLSGTEVHKGNHWRFVIDGGADFNTDKYGIPKSAIPEGYKGGVGFFIEF